MVIKVPPIMLTKNLEWLKNEHVVQSLLNFCLFGLVMEPHLTTYHSNVGV